MTTATMEPKPVKLTPGMLAWFGLVGVLLFIGITAAIMVFWNGLVVTNMNDTVPWGLWITIDLTAIALGAGAYTLSAIVYNFGISASSRLFDWRCSSASSATPALADFGYGHWAPGPLLASMGLLEHPLGLVGNHLVHYHLSDDHAAGVPACDRRVALLRPRALVSKTC
jgi:hypothetical protein